MYHRLQKAKLWNCYLYSRIGDMEKLTAVAGGLALLRSDIMTCGTGRTGGVALRQDWWRLGRTELVALRQD